MSRAVAASDRVTTPRWRRLRYTPLRDLVRLQLTGRLDLDRAAVRRPGADLTICAWSGTLQKALTAAEELAGDGIEAEVIDLRTLRPLDDATINASVARTSRAMVVDEGWRSVGLSAEVAARITESCFYHLDAPVARVCGWASQSA